MIEDFLIDEALLPPDELEKVIAARATLGGTLGQHLVGAQMIDPDELARLLSRRLALPLCSEEQLKTIAPRVVQRLSPEVAIEHRAIPLHIEGDSLVVAMADPSVRRSVDEVSFFCGMYVLRAVATEPSIDWALAHYYGHHPKPLPQPWRPEPASGELRELFPGQAPRSDAPPPSDASTEKDPSGLILLTRKKSDPDLVLAAPNADPSPPLAAAPSAARELPTDDTDPTALRPTDEPKVVVASDLWTNDEKPPGRAEVAAPRPSAIGGPRFVDLPPTRSIVRADAPVDPVAELLSSSPFDARKTQPVQSLATKTVVDDLAALAEQGEGDGEETDVTLEVPAVARALEGPPSGRRKRPTLRMPEPPAVGATGPHRVGAIPGGETGPQPRIDRSIDAGGRPRQAIAPKLRRRRKTLSGVAVVKAPNAKTHRDVELSSEVAARTDRLPSYAAGDRDQAAGKLDAKPARKRATLSADISNSPEVWAPSARDLAGKYALVAGRLREARKRSDVARLALDFLGVLCQQRALLKLKRNVLSGWASAGGELDERSIQSLWLPLEQASVFDQVRKSRIPYRGPLAFGKAERLFASFVGHHAEDMILVPMVVGDRVVGMLYGDGLAVEDIPLPLLRDLANTVAAALARISKKR